MQTVGQFLTQCGARLAPFERRGVGRIGCGVSVVAIALALLALALGLRDTGGSLSAGFRFVVVSGLGAVIFVFLIYAAIETIIERSVRRGIAEYLRDSGNELSTLVSAAEMRRTQMPGGEKLLAVLKDCARE